MFEYFRGNYVWNLATNLTLGSGGLIGEIDTVARSPADGFTLFFAVPALVTNPFFMKQSHDPALLAQFPEGYRHLAYLQSGLGYPIKRDMPGLKGEAVERLYASGAKWLKGEALDR